MPGSDIRRLSFRDPISQVVQVNGYIYRAVDIAFQHSMESLLRTSWFESRAERRQFPATSWCECPAECINWGRRWVWLRHERLEFPLYPHEITMLQLYESALLTLEIADEALSTGYMLKDASAWNVLHQDGRPVFCDLTSFIPHDGNPLWLPYGQFGRHFIIPLLLGRYLCMTPSEIFLLHRDGVTPEHARRLLGFWRSVSSLPALEFVLLPDFLRDKACNRKDVPEMERRQDTSRAIEAHRLMLGRLRRYVLDLNPAQLGRHTEWSAYTSTRDHYNEAALQQKREFIAAALGARRGRVLDLGCNTGEYAMVAANLGRPVVATDIDHQSLQLLHMAKADYPLSAMALNVANPTPAIGWRNSEVASLLDRSVGVFSTVVCVGLIHHLLVTARIPLADVLELLAELSTEDLIIEWVEPNDSKFSEIAGPNIDLYSHYDRCLFEHHLSENWIITRKLQLSGTHRTIYYATRVAGERG